MQIGGRQIGKRNSRLLVLFSLFSDLRFYTPVLVVWFATVTGSLTSAGFVVAAAYVASAAFEVPTGTISDRLGRRAALIAGAVAAVGSVVAYAAASGLQLLLLGAVLDGLSRALYSGNNDALLHDSLAEDDAVAQFARRYGHYQSAVHLATTFAAPIGSLLAAQSFRLVLWVSVVPQVVALLLALLVHEPRRAARATSVPAHLKASVVAFRKNSRLRLLSVAYALEYGIGEASWQLRPAFLITVWPLWALGLAPMAGGLMAVLSFWYAGRVVGRFGPARSLFGFSVLHRAGAMAAFGWPTVASPLIVASTGLGQGIGSTAQAQMLQAELTDEQRATVASLVSLGGSLVLAVAAVAIGAAADAFGPARALLSAEIVLLLPLWCYWLLHRRTSKAAKSGSPRNERA